MQIIHRPANTDVPRHPSLSARRATLTFGPFVRHGIPIIGERRACSSGCRLQNIEGKSVQVLDVHHTEDIRRARL